MERLEELLIGSLVAVIALVVVLLGWSFQHNAQDYMKPCILAGYDTAEWDLFAPEPVCIKITPISQVEQ